MRLVFRTAAVVAATAAFACAVLSGGVADATTLSGAQSTFLASASRAARLSQATYGVPASVTVAQAILESGWGRSALSRTANNYFGMTCGRRGAGPIAIGCRAGADRHCDANGCRPSTARFRVYASAADSFRDHGLLFVNMPRYATAYLHRTDPDRFAVELHRAGYATDPQYAARLTAIMKKYDLYRLNRAD
ncbi:glucosaminidase [Virgisporangium aliadipatigenens]|uniref:Glucosaminidase n=1 Tax=Virgisporangium aliadipatigenens TaxID=741659 RepID=A0A8J4DT74_9ACTN|nr:glucosaminidase domain-containing protein [Virgisporangium aliadipatigenens]GIJ49494.1 glucosaminidase [Virgisporangium aliadipatigenens]